MNFNYGAAFGRTRYTGKARGLAAIELLWQLTTFGKKLQDPANCWSRRRYQVTLHQKMIFAPNWSSLGLPLRVVASPALEVPIVVPGVPAITTL